MEKHSPKTKNMQETLENYKEIVKRKVENNKTLTPKDKGLSNDGNKNILDYAVLRPILSSGYADIHNMIDIGGSLDAIIELQKKLNDKGIKTKICWYPLRNKAYIEACKELMIDLNTSNF